MHTGRTLTVFRWRPPQKKFGDPQKFGDPPENLEAPPQKIGDPPCEQNDRRLWKYYLGQNFVSAGNKRSALASLRGLRPHSLGNPGSATEVI